MSTVNLNDLYRIVSAILENKGVCHGMGHAFEVLEWSKGIAREIADQYPTDSKILEAIAITHDCWDRKFENTISREAVLYALHNSGFSTAVADMIPREVDLISYSKGDKPKTTEGLIVQDADRLTAIGANGIYRCFAYSAMKGIPFNKAIEHFEEKLIKLEETMNFDVSKKIARGLTVTIEEFIVRAKAEMLAMFHFTNV